MRNVDAFRAEAVWFIRSQHYAKRGSFGLNVVMAARRGALRPAQTGRETPLRRLQVDMP